MQQLIQAWQTDRETQPNTSNEQCEFIYQLHLYINFISHNTILCSFIFGNCIFISWNCSFISHQYILQL